jgi:hypothetical protein
MQEELTTGLKQQQQQQQQQPNHFFSSNYQQPITTLELLLKGQLSPAPRHKDNLEVEQTAS